MVMTAIIMLMPHKAMILMMLVNLDIVSKTSRFQRFWGRLLPIYPFHHRQSKIHPRKNHNYYYVCMSTAFIKGRLNPVGFTDCSHRFFANFSTSPTIFNQPKPERTDENSFPLVTHHCYVPLCNRSTFMKRQNFPSFYSILKYSCWFFFHIKGSAVYFLVVCPKSN